MERFVINKQNQKFYKRLFLKSVRIFWVIPGGIFELIMFVLLNAFLEIFSKEHTLRYLISHKEINSTYLIYLVISIFSLQVILFFSIYFLLILFILSTESEKNDPERIQKIFNSKVAIVYCYGGLFHYLFKFIISFFVAKKLKTSTLILFSLSPHEEIKISTNIVNEIEKKLKTDSEKKEWSYLFFDTIRAMTDERLPKGTGPKWYCQK